MRIRGFQRLAWEWSRFRAKINKQRFMREMAETIPIYLRQLPSPGAPPLEVISFSGAADFPEQVLSMLTFLARIGRPRCWTLYSDGTLGAAQERILAAMPFPVRLAVWNKFPPAGTESPALLRYAEAHPLGKKYFAISHHPLNATVLYADSDVLFYPQAGQMIATAAQDQHWFLPDIPDAAALDQGLPDHLVDVPHQVNSGLMILQPGFDWSAGNNYIAGKDGRWGYFSEQTAVHISMLANGARPLDPTRFVVSARDQFEWRQAFDLKEMAARHYVTTVRRFIWCSGWKRHFVL